MLNQGVFIDFTKAFDTIDNNILLQKLPYYNFRPSPCHLLSSYLSDRKQFVKIKDQPSNMKNISIGVPQGTVLGPVLFQTFINDLINSAPNLEYILLDDDTNISSTTQGSLIQSFKELSTGVQQTASFLTVLKHFRLFSSHQIDSSLIRMITLLI